MVPAAVIAVDDDLPLLASGKVDRGALIMQLTCAMVLVTLLLRLLGVRSKRCSRSSAGPAGRPWSPSIRRAWPAA